MSDLHNHAPGDALAAEVDTQDETLEETPLRRTLTVGVLCVGTALVAGGLFSGIVTPRLVAVIATVIGAALAYWLGRLRGPTLVAIGTVGGIFVAGVICAAIVGGLGAVTDIADLVSEALKQSDILRPPIRMSTGFAALVGWLMAGVGFGAVWTAIVVKRPAMSMLVPLPVAAVCAISSPRDVQLASGVILLVSFVLGFFLLSSDRGVTGAEHMPVAYELRRAAKALPLVAAIVAALIALSQSNFLFPDPIINPALEAQKPKSVPISDAPDRVLFDVRSSVSGPWVMGVLDVYDGTDWRLPPFDDARLVDIPRSGVVDRSFDPAVRARVTVRGLGGAVLPGLANTVGVIARGPKLTFDSRAGNIRLVEGEINPGFTYSLAGAGQPQVEDLRLADAPPDVLVERFTDTTAPPPSAQDLIDEAPKDSLWDQWDYLRRYVLDNITVAGSGRPVEIPSDRVEEILVEKEGSPFELVAIQTLFARWVGIPARIGYGFDGGERKGELLEVRPRDGAVFPQVYFSGLGWLPVIGTPQKTKVTDTSDPNLQQYRPGVLPSDDISVTIFRPVELPGSSQLYAALRRAALIIAALLLLAGIVYLSLAPIRKAVRRSRRRNDAIDAGPHARIAQSYAEWRDLLTDFGYHYETDTPLMLLRRFPPDDEHNQLAWLVTRALWGDLVDDVTDETAADAEELSRAMRRRLREAHPITVRGVAVLSRLSLRSPFAVPIHERTHRPIDERELIDAPV